MLIDFCQRTKGYYYIELQHNQESFLNLFNLEATISVQDREENAYGKVKQLQRRQSMFFDKPAIVSKQVMDAHRIYR